MASEFGTGKSIVVLAIVVGCFAILWPKIFYPMMQAAFAITSSDGEEIPYRPRDRPPHIQPGIINTKARKTAEDGVYIKDGKPFPHPSTRQPVKPQPKSGGAMSIVMPIYTIGIVVFFLYTVLKLVFKKPPEEEKKPLIKDFHMDPNYHKFVCQQSTREGLKKVEKPNVSSIIEEDEGEEEDDEEEVEKEAVKEKSGSCDDKDYEIYKLRRKLEETEIAMQRIMQHMGKVSDCLTNACLLKEAGINSGDILKEMSYNKPDYRLGTTKPTLRVNKRRKKKLSSDIKPEPIVLSYPSKIDEDKLQKEEKGVEKPSVEEDADLKMKRDSSINSDNSSFELLSQGMSCSSLAADISDSESVTDINEADLSKSNIANAESFDAVDEETNSADAECKQQDDENDKFVESTSDIDESKGD